jgi:hypothetical protein
MARRLWLTFSAPGGAVCRNRLSRRRRRIRNSAEEEFHHRPPPEASRGPCRPRILVSRLLCFPLLSVRGE